MSIPSSPSSPQESLSLSPEKELNVILTNLPPGMEAQVQKIRTAVVGMTDAGLTEFVRALRAEFATIMNKKENSFSTKVISIMAGKNRAGLQDLINEAVLITPHGTPTVAANDNRFQLKALG